MNNKSISTKTLKKLVTQESQNIKLTNSKDRQKQLGEVFTPTPLVLEILNKLPKGKDGAWVEDKTFLDPACGNGQFLAAVLIIKKELGHHNPLYTIYGVDIMEDNVQECRERLLAIAGDTPINRKVVERKIVCADALTYNYTFGQDDFDDREFFEEL